MGILSKLKRTQEKPKRLRSGFAAAEVSRLTASLTYQAEYINRTLRSQLRLLRSRSREAAQNNPYAKRFANMAANNIAGPNPFKLNAKVKNARGELDVLANRRIETQWEIWKRKEYCDISNRLSLNAIFRLLSRTLAIDGEFIIRKHRGEGPHGLQLQLIDVDRLDENKNEILPGGGAIITGIEFNSYEKPIAYHLLKRKPSDYMLGTIKEYDRVPADEIIHCFIPMFAEQARGIPWIHAAMLNLVHMGAFQEAAVIAARIGASQMGFIESNGEDFLFDSEDSYGNPEIEAEPGYFPVLAPGQKVHNWNPKYPDSAIQPFNDAILHGISAGLDVAHHNLSGNMAAVNYSSARIAELGERDMWKSVQDHVIDHAVLSIYDDWIRGAMTYNILPYDYGKASKYMDVRFQGRRWQWVDPQKEINANVEALDNKLKSATRIAAENGDDIEEIYAELEAEKLLREKFGLENQQEPDNETDDQGNQQEGE